VTRPRPRILLVIDNLHEDVGGAERFFVGLATHLPRERFEVRTLTTRAARGPLLETLQAAGIPHVNLGRRNKYDYHRLLGLARVLRRDRIDVLHTHKFGSNASGTVIGALCRVPVIVAHEQTWSYEGQPLRKFLDGHVIGRLADRFVSVSTADRERMISREGVPAAKTLVIPNAYVPRAVESRTDLRAELGLAAGTPLVGTAVQMRPQKALEVLLDAHVRVLRQVPDAHLVVAGDGPERARVEQLVGRLGLGERVSLLGMREDVDGILRSLDVVALSSDYEGTPLLAFECMAHRTPLVATDVGGLRDVVEDGVTGILVPRRDPEALAAAIVGLLRDPRRRHDLAEAAYARLGTFTMDAVAARFADLYDELLAR
jgi:glycosyltransferase involved in cell wall biosynthesis